MQNKLNSLFKQSKLSFDAKGKAIAHVSAKAKAIANAYTKL